MYGGPADIIIRLIVKSIALCQRINGKKDK